MFIDMFGGVKLVLAVSIQHAHSELTVINAGKNVKGYAIKSYPKPYILLDWVWIKFLDVIYFDSKLINAKGIITGIPADKKIPIKITRLNWANS